jgi:tyrosine-protein phosphatase YwqE
MDLYGTLERIKAKGYYPVLAHPERYVYMGKKEYRKLKEMNVMFQLNLASLIGVYGKHTKGKAEWLLDRDFYGITGSDIHSIHGFQSICFSKTRNKLYTKIWEL